MRLFVYITLAALVISCNPALEKTAEPTASELQIERIADAEGLQQASKDYECLSDADIDFIDQEVAAIESEIQQNETAVLVSRLSPAYNESLTPEERDEVVTIIKDFFSKRGMTSEFRQEVKTEKRFVPGTQSNCEVFLIVQNFPVSEFSYAFKMLKLSGRLAFQEIQIIG